MATTKSIISRANNRFTKLIKREIIEKDAIITGDMLRSIDTVFKEKSNGNIEIVLGSIYYYVYVDQGTKHIKARKITEDVLNSDSFNEILEDLMFEWNDLRINEMLLRVSSKSSGKIKIKI